MPGLAVGAVDLDDGAASTTQGAGEPGSVGAGPLDAEPRRWVAEPLGPAEQASIAGGGGGDLEVPQGPPQVPCESRRDVDLTVGVDADGDAARGLVHDARRSHPHVLHPRFAGPDWGW